MTTLEDVVKAVNSMGETVTTSLKGFADRLDKVEAAKPAAVEDTKATKGKGETPDSRMKAMLSGHRNWHDKNQAGEAVTPFPAGLAHDVVVVVTPKDGKAVSTPVKKTRGITTAKALVVDAIRKGYKVEVTNK